MSFSGSRHRYLGIWRRTPLSNSTCPVEHTLWFIHPQSANERMANPNNNHFLSSVNEWPTITEQVITLSGNYNVINWFAWIIIIGPEPLSGVPPALILWLRIIVLLPQKTKKGSVRDEREEVVCFKIPSSYVCYSDLQEPGLDFEWHLLAQRRASNIDDTVILLSRRMRCR